jgi:hypothetical protein
MTNYSLLDKHDLETLSEALYFMKIAELKKACLFLSLSEEGNKNEMIERIIIFITTGRIEKPQPMPSQSLAKNYPLQSLSSNSLMLYGGYKNDLQTRVFFKHLIGLQFHFTAYGIDWLNDRWLKGNPPTYQEFANYWIEETNRRKKIKTDPKKEWAFIRFMQHMNEVMPDASREQLMQEWKKIQVQKVFLVHNLLKKALTLSKI